MGNRSDHEQLKALVLDDDARFLQTMQKMLEGKGCAVEAVSDSDKAAALAVCQHFHIAFVDCILRSSQGTDFVRRLREYVGSSVDVVLMSGIVNKQSVSGIFNENYAREFLPKPISPFNIDRILSRARERYIYNTGGGGGLLLKLFDSSGFSLHKLKYIIALKKAGSAEICLVTAALLAAKENVSIKFSADGKRYHKIFLQKGLVLDYQTNDSGRILSALFSQNIITAEEAKSFEGKGPDQMLGDLTKSCLISSWQASEIKRGAFLDSLAAAGPEMSLEIKLFAYPGKGSFQISQSDFADIAFRSLKQCPLKVFDAVFSGDIMESSLKFKDSSIQHLPEAAALAKSLKSGMKLKGALEDFIAREEEPPADGKQTGADFYPCLTHILLKGGAFFADRGQSMRLAHITERYRQLGRFFEKSDSERVFSVLGGALDEQRDFSDKSFTQKLYSMFMKGNHRDNFPSEIPNELEKAINKAGIQLKKHYDALSSPDSEENDSTENQKRIQKELEMGKVKKACKFFLEQGRHEEAAGSFKSLPEEVMEKDTMFQILYLWLSFADPKRCDQQRKKRFLKKILNELNMEMKENYLYQYVIGLYYEEKGADDPAESAFRRAEKIEPSFRPASFAVRKYKIKKAAKKKSGNFLSMLSDLSKKKIGGSQKKAG